MKLLIAEDSASSRLILERTVRKWDYEVVVARDGDEAWGHLCSENPPRLAILDWMMPGRSGLELTKLVRELGREGYTYIILLTSRTDKQDIIEGLTAGADDYISKPFHEDELAARVRTGRRILDLQDELLAAREALRIQATHDSLTGLLNRGMVLETLAKEVSRASREGTQLAVTLLDLDHFKNVNDTYGHETGDAVLREIAARLKSSVRPYDAVGRYGGEEFLLLLPGCDMAGATSQTERLRTRLASEPILTGAGRLIVTGSFGVTSYSPGVAGEDLVRVADEALYEAKRAGRNRVIYRSPSSDLDAELVDGESAGARRA